MSRDEMIEKLSKQSRFVELPKELVMASCLNVYCEISPKEMTRFVNLVRKNYCPATNLFVVPAIQDTEDYNSELFDYQESGKYTKSNEITFLDEYHQLLSQISDKGLRAAIQDSIADLEKADY